jgi:hypothetical protein
MKILEKMGILLKNLTHPPISVIQDNQSLYNPSNLLSNFIQYFLTYSE